MGLIPASLNDCFTCFKRHEWRCIVLLRWYSAVHPTFMNNQYRFETCCEDIVFPECVFESHPEGARSVVHAHNCECDINDLWQVCFSPPRKKLLVLCCSILFSVINYHHEGRPAGAAKDKKCLNFFALILTPNILCILFFKYHRKCVFVTKS